MKRVFYFGDGNSEGDSKRRDLLGGKGAGLAEMTSIGLPVPPGFTFSTECASAMLTDPPLSAGKPLPSGLEDELEAALAKLETSTKRRFGDPTNPLLLSVRSGARVSMPGMMDTVLNLGLNDATAEGLAKMTGAARFAFDAYRRFIAMYADVAMGLPKSPFERALDDARLSMAKKRKVDAARLNSEELKRAIPDSELDEDELRALVAKFKDLVKTASGTSFPEDPKTQLRGAILAVFRSWKNHRAIVYRRMHGIPETWGTACNIQAMVFGNLGETSGTGVAFTRNPSTGERALYGEWLPNAQGEDVVAGIRTPFPLSGVEDHSLERSFPDAFKTLVEICTTLEQHYRDMQDLEFTIERGTLYMLQCRTGKRTAKASVRIAVDLVSEKRIDEREAILRVDAGALEQMMHPTLDPDAEKEEIARGLAASPGAASGHVVFDADEAERIGGQGKPVILARVETSPEDIHGMKAARGIITARGGMTSHAAVVARGMGKPCVAGCSALAIDYAGAHMTITQYDDQGTPTGSVVIKKDDLITMDGASGRIYKGAVPTVAASLTGEFATLMSWADEVRRLGVRANADTAIDAQTARSFGAEGIGLCRTEHMFFDEARIRAMRELILADDVEARQAALKKLEPVQREDFVGLFRAMDGLPVTIRLLDPPLHEFLPHELEQMEEIASDLRTSVERIRTRVIELKEFNPMLGHRGVRLGITYPEIYAMQARAILSAAQAVTKEGKKVHVEIMIPLAFSNAELVRMRDVVDRAAAEVLDSEPSVSFAFGTMIELPRAALCADDLAKSAEFFSFGTNDLTQCTLGLSRDDAGRFLPSYVDLGLLPADPFVSIDEPGVGALVHSAIERGRKGRPGIKLGICGEHGGDPKSVDFFHRAGLDYVSCSPFRVPIARLAAAQAAVRSAQKSD